MTITINQGKITGRRNKSVLTGASYYSFTGIPYAKPPVGDLRFKPPEKADGWSGTLSATVVNFGCLGTMPLTSVPTGSEDCLYLNVYAKKILRSYTQLKPVMVHIHGGGFLFGSGCPVAQNGDFLINYDVVLVTFNYRTNIFGFLNLDLPDCPGNVGLKDQIMALKWVQENIKFFGGDPDNVTLFGHSAGASSIHYLMLSPATDGLYHKCILHSGNAFCLWSFDENPYKTILDYCQLLGFNSTDRNEILDFLKRTAAKHLNNAVMKLKRNRRMKNPGTPELNPFMPSIDVLQNGAVIIDRPINLLSRMKKVPVMFGLNDIEAGIMLLKVKPDDMVAILSQEFEAVVKRIFASEQVPKVVIQKIKEFYFPDKYITIEQAVQLYNDIFIEDPYKPWGTLIEENIPVFANKFTYSDGTLSTARNELCNKYNMTLNGSFHGDELRYLLFPSYLRGNMNTEFELSVADTKVVENMCTIWTNFAKYSNPNSDGLSVDWKPLSTDRYSYVEINENLTVKEGRINEANTKFWNDLRELMKTCN